MKYVLQFLSFLVLGLIAYGLFLNNETFQTGDKFIGIGILVMAFVLMPLFIYHRYKNKKIEDFMFKKDNEEGEN